MPLYEYRCHSCSKQFEFLVRGDERPAECPSCRGHEFERVMSTFAAHAGGRRSSASPLPSGPCGSCGHPDGPGACNLN